MPKRKSFIREPKRRPRLLKDIPMLPAVPLIMALSGCAAGGVINAYSGPEQADRDVAILFTPKDDPSSGEQKGAALTGIDGKNFGTELAGFPAVIKVMPGTVTVKVRCISPFNISSFRLFTAKLEAGHYYELICEQWSASYIDRGTDYNSVKSRLPDSVRDKLRR